MATATLSEVFNPDRIQRLAGVRAFERARLIPRSAIGDRTETDGRLSATVRGTLPYSVALWIEGTRKAAYACSCPQGDDDKFCKHTAALALTLHEPTQDVGEPPTEQRIRSRMAADRGETAVDIKEWRKRVTKAFGRPSHFVDYYEAPGWAQRVNDLFDDLRQLLEDGHADAVIPLVEYAFERADKATQYVDSSDGCFGQISWDIEDLHLRACTEARPDPVALTRRLVEYELKGELDVFRRSAQRYADVLGPDGLAEYRKLIQPQFDALGPPEPYGFSSERLHLTNAMLGLTRAQDDPDEFIAVASQSLHSPHAYEEIVEVLTDADRIDEALDWAHRGLAMEGREFQKGALRDQLVTLLNSLGEAEAAVAVRQDAFHNLPSLTAHNELLEQVSEAGGDRDAQRIAALDWLRARAIQEDGTAYGSILVEILLHEGEVDHAWETAQTVGCNRRWWMTLAQARSKEHPADAIPIYEDAVEEQIDRKKKNAYGQAVKLMARLEKLHHAAGDDGWEPYLAELTNRHARKSSLMAKIRAKWPDV